jgi:hypothetical protein
VTATPAQDERKRFIEPERIDPLRAYAKILDALDYYQAAFGLSDTQIAAAVIVYGAGKEVPDNAVDAAVKDLMKAYQDRVAQDCLLGTTDRSRMKIRVHLAAAGVDIRAPQGARYVEREWSRGERTAYRGRVDSSKIDDYIAAGDFDKAYMAGASLRYIGTRIGRKHTLVRDWLKKAGVEMRPPRGGRRAQPPRDEGRPLQPFGRG